MTAFRLLEKQTSDGDWMADGVAYVEGELFLFFRSLQTMPLQINDLQDLNEKHFPYEKQTRFRWSPVKEWDSSEPFEPEKALVWAQQKYSGRADFTRNLSHDEIIAEFNEVLRRGIINEFQRARAKEYFIQALESGFPLPKHIVEPIWQQLSYSNWERPPFDRTEHNIALLLYARAFDLPIEDYPAQVKYLDDHAELYAPVFKETSGWGARASISGEVKTSSESPVMNVWLYKNQSVIQKMVIVGNGLRQFEDELFTDFLLTAMRVQATDQDFVNSGVVSIESTLKSDSKNVKSDPKNIVLPAVGESAPLSGVETSTGPFEDLLTRLRQLNQETGFVQIYEIDMQLAKDFNQNMLDILKEAPQINQPILWVPERDDGEMVVLQPLREFSTRQHIGGKTHHPSPVEIELSLDLIQTEKWNKLMKTCQEEVINTIYTDAKIKLDYYKNRIKSLDADVKRWDTADPETRQLVWGPSITLNQRFDDETGLTVWLRDPIVKSTSEYFSESIPLLIEGHERWAIRMNRLIDDLKDASGQQGNPFRHLIMTRLFDSAIRGRPFPGSARVQRRYNAWVRPVENLLRFLLRYRFDRPGMDLDDLFNAHTTFSLAVNIDEARNGIYGIFLQPQSLVDARRSIIVVDPSRPFVIIKDPTDMPVQHHEPVKEINIREKLEGEWKNLDSTELSKTLREEFVKNPLLVIQTLQLLGPRIEPDALNKDRVRIEQIQKQTEKLNFDRLIELATNATLAYAQLTMMKSLEEAQEMIPSVIKRWQDLKEINMDKNSLLAKPVPDQKQLACRLYLLRAVYLTILSGNIVKEYLTSIYGSPSSLVSQDIRQALDAANELDAEFTKKWLDSLAQWEFISALDVLRRYLPKENYLFDMEQTQVASVFDGFDLIESARRFRNAMVDLNTDHETRATAYLKVGQAIENSMITYSSSTVPIAYQEMRHLLEILTGRELSFGGGLRS